MSRNDKMKFIRLIEGSDMCINDALAKYDVPRGQKSHKPNKQYYLKVNPTAIII